MPELRPDFQWVGEPRLQQIFDALEADGEARLVGGCVRDSLLGETPFANDAIDIDIAVTLTPPAMKKALAASGIRAVATGEDHGTITAINGGLVAECTTLRADTDTDGRRATVRFSTDWDEDWRRRDFTVNALYADRHGQIFDPPGGVEDLRSGIVKFIGDPAKRIQEDALRIMRFFRFSARFAEAFDPEGIAAVTEGRARLDILSRERVWSELSRTFAASRAPAALDAAKSAGVLAHVLPGEPRTDVFMRLHATEIPSHAVALAALWPSLDAATLRDRLKPSKALIDRYAETLKARDAIAGGAKASRLLYVFGREVATDAAKLVEAEGQAVSDVIAELDSADLPRFLLSGKDVIARGVAPGPEVSRLLALIEKHWLDAGAPSNRPDQDQLLDDVLSREAAR